MKVADRQILGESVPQGASGSSLPRFKSIKQTDIPFGRNGKHKKIVTELLSDICRLEPGRALKVPIAALPDSKENIRSALRRATRRRGIEVASSSDQDFFYIWNVLPKR